MQQQPAILLPVIGDVEAQQRRLAHVDAEMSWIEARIKLFGNVAPGRVQLDLLHLQRRLAPHHLHRLGETFPDHRGTQNIVPADYRLQSCDIAIQTFTAVKARLAGHRYGSPSPPIR